LTAKTFAAPASDYVPAIATVRLEATEGQLIAVATDRFVLGASRADYAGEAFAATVDLASVDTLIRIAKTAKNDAGWREVTIETGDNTLEFRFTSGESLSVRISDHEFPSWRQLLPSETLAETETDHDVPARAFNAGKLAKFAKVQGHENMRLFQRGPSKPTVVVIGDDFVGLIMTVRNETERWQRPEWLAA
jgi:hypothetical protein